MFEKAKSTLASLFGQLAEAQQTIDDSARKIVAGIAGMIDVVDDEAPSSREALAGRDFSWYQEMTNALTSDGFSPPAAFEPRAWLSRPPESRTLVEYALGDDGATVASWFAIAATETRPERRAVTLFTLFEDGSSLDTETGGSPATLPPLDTERTDRLRENAPVPLMLARHRASVAVHGSAPRRFESIDAYHASRQERNARRAAYRQGLGLSLVEQYLEARFAGDKAAVGREYLDAVRKHPEWYKYASGNAGAATPADSSGANSTHSEGTSTQGTMPLNFLASPTPDGRNTLTTFGMLLSGLPELIVSDVAANHWRAARAFAGAVASGIARIRRAVGNDAAFVAQLVSPTGMRIVLTHADAIAAGLSQVGGTPGSHSVDVHLTLRGFTPADEPSLLGVNPLPDDPRTFDDRLREACARLGVDVPDARGADTADEAMRDAHERAVVRLDEVRARWQNRVAAQEQVLVKYRATKADRGEYVWLEVRDWRDGELDGEVVTPAPRVGLSLGQQLTIKESEVFDQLVVGPTGPEYTALTDLVATDYGQDV